MIEKWILKYTELNLEELMQQLRQEALDLYYYNNTEQTLLETFDDAFTKAFAASQE